MVRRIVPWSYNGKTFTGERLNYTNYKPGEPNNAASEFPDGEHCLQKSPIYPGWNDRSCNYSATGYVCEFTNE